MCVTAALGAAGSAAQLGAAGLDLFNKPGQIARQNELANRSLEMAAADRRNQALLTALGMRRSVAGTSDSEGNTTTFDPGGNVWRSQLGPIPQAAQRSSDQATTLVNTTQLPMQLRANEQEAIRAAEARRVAAPLMAEAASFRPRTAGDVAAETTATAAQANREATRPILADTLRANARSGTAAAPIITALANRSADALRNALLTARSTAPQQAASQNQSILDAIRQRLSVIGSGGAAFGGVGPAPSNANALLTQLLAARAQGSGNTAMAGAANIPQGGYAMQAALRNAQPVGSPLPSQVLAIGDILGNIGNAPWLQALLRDRNPGTQGDRRGGTAGEA